MRRSKSSYPTQFENREKTDFDLGSGWNYYECWNLETATQELLELRSGGDSQREIGVEGSCYGHSGPILHHVLSLRMS